MRQNVNRQKAKTNTANVSSTVQSTSSERKQECQVICQPTVECICSAKSLDVMN